MEELNTISALLPDTVDTPEWIEERKTVGNRAEAYTVKWERTRGDPRVIFHVARDSDTLGWDVEDRSVPDRRKIEVKGRRDSNVIFNLSENEWNKAQQNGPLYELQFWGNIDLKTNAEVEYAALTAAGYPIRIENLALALGSGEWEMTPTSWRVRRLV